jgi:hypothetical protein
MLFAVVLFGSTVPPPRQLTDTKFFISLGSLCLLNREKKDNERYKEGMVTADGEGVETNKTTANKKGFFYFFMYVLHSKLLRLPTPQIPLCRRLLGSNPEVEVIKLNSVKISRFLQLLSHSRGFFARV